MVDLEKYLVFYLQYSTLEILKSRIWNFNLPFSQIVEGVSHDSVNRFLLRENYTPKDLLKDTEGKIDMVGGVISVDDMVLDKPYSDSN